MKKLTVLASLITSFLNAGIAFAQDRTIFIDRPGLGFRSVGDFVSKALILTISFGALIVLFMLIWGAFEWITSGGDKEGVGKARGRIINALIGLAILAVVFALARLIGAFTGLDLTNITVPSPDPAATGL